MTSAARVARRFRAARLLPAARDLMLRSTQVIWQDAHMIVPVVLVRWLCRAVLPVLVLLITTTHAGRAAPVEPPLAFCKESIALDVQEVRCRQDTVLDYAPLVRFPRLTRLSLVGSAALRDIRQLPKLAALRTLNVSGTALGALVGLERMPQLEELKADWTWVDDLRPLALLTQLRVLSLAHTPVADLAPLSALAALQKLDLCDTRVRDLGPLVLLDKLQELRLCETPADLASLLARRPDLKVITGPPAGVEESVNCRLVATDAGTVLMNSLNQRLGTQRRAALWFASPQYSDAWLLQRRSGPLLEGYHVKAQALRDVKMHQIEVSWLTPPATPTELASRTSCRAQGLCNVELRAGASLPEGALWTGVIAAADFKLLRPLRLCRRGAVIEIRRSAADWLAPAVGDLDRLGLLRLGSDDVRTSAEEQLTMPPPCAAAPR